MEGSSNSDDEKMLKLHLQPLNVDLSSNSDSDDSLFSFLDSESETDDHLLCETDNKPLNVDLSSNSDGDDNLFSFLDSESETGDHLLRETDNKSYDELLKKFNENEEKLRVANLKVRRLEEEIIKWKNQVENSDDQLVNVCEELKLKEEKLDKQNEVSERNNSNWKIEVEKMNNRLDNMRDEMNRELEEWNKLIDEMDTEFKITDLGHQLKEANHQLKMSKAEIARLKAERERNSFETRQLQDELKLAVPNMAKLDSILVSKRDQIVMLEEMVSMYKANETNHELEMQKLKAEMLNSQAEFSSEQDALLLHIATLTGMQAELGSKLEDFASRNNELEEKLKQYEAEKSKQEELHATCQMVLQDEIRNVREELSQRKHDAEAVKKELNMVMAKRDEANAMIGKFKADIFFRDKQISDMTKYRRLYFELSREFFCYRHRQASHIFRAS